MMSKYDISKPYLYVLGNAVKYLSVSACIHFQIHPDTENLYLVCICMYLYVFVPKNYIFYLCGKRAHNVRSFFFKLHAFDNIRTCSTIFQHITARMYPIMAAMTGGMNVHGDSHGHCPVGPDHTIGADGTGRRDWHTTKKAYVEL